MRRYALVCLVVYPIGVPCLYCLLLWRSRHTLEELRRIELVQETDLALAKLQARAARTDVQREEIMQRANVVYQASRGVYDRLRGQLLLFCLRCSATFRNLCTAWHMS